MHEDQPGLFDLGPTEVRGRFEPARLTQARLRRRMTKAEVAGRVGVSAAAIGQYESGVTAPREEVVAGLASALAVPASFFAVGRPIVRMDATRAHFRSLRSTPVADRQRAIANATLLWELVFTLERYVKLPDVDLPALEEGTSPAQAAAALRNHWSIPDGPIRHLVANAESRGIVVSVRPLDEIEKVDAFSLQLVGRPIIITTPRRSANVFRHRFSVAHEIGHLLLHSEGSSYTAVVEHEADAFAAALLTPAASMELELPRRLDLVALDRTARTWGVSTTSLVRRMVEMGRATDSSARRAYQRFNATYEPDADPTSAYPGETPTLLQKAADLAADYGGTVPALADAMKLTTHEVRDLLGVPDQRPSLRLIPGV